jgi:hypothetical protein
MAIATAFALKALSILSFGFHAAGINAHATRACHIDDQWH